MAINSNLERSENAQLTLSVYQVEMGFELTSSLSPPAEVYSTHNQTNSFTYEWEPVWMNSSEYESLFYHIRVSDENRPNLFNEFITYKPFFTVRVSRWHFWKLKSQLLDEKLDFGGK